MDWYIKLYRKSTENYLYFAEKFTRRQAWQDLLLLANYKDSFFYIRWNLVTLKRWQLCYAENTLADRWKRSREKTRSFLLELETSKQIIQQKNKLCSLYTIVNYDTYQTTEHTTEQTTEKQQNRQQKNIYNKDNNILYNKTNFQEFINLNDLEKDKPLNKEMIKCLEYMVELGYEIKEKPKELTKRFITTIWSYFGRNPEGQLIYVDFNKEVLSRYTHHKEKQDHIEKYKMSLLTRFKNYLKYKQNKKWQTLL